jgi:PadR family transcriptional regulator PadR
MVDGATSTQLRRGVVGPCILALLSSGPRYGLQLVKELDEIGGLLSSLGTVYPLLNRLQESGFVSSRWEITDDERPRRYYELTEAGSIELRSFTDDWRTFSSTVSGLLGSIPNITTESEMK